MTSAACYCLFVCLVFLFLHCVLAQIPTSVFSSFNEIFTVELTVTFDIFRPFESKL